MILPMTEVDTIKHIQKAHTSHMTAFESVFDKVERKEKERKEKAENERKKKVAILQKQRLEKRKATAARKAKETQRHDAKNREGQQLEQRNVAESSVSTNNNSSGGRESIQQTNTIGSTWSEVSPEAAADYMASKTGVPVSRWMAIIYHESTNNPTVTNSIGCFGYLQLHPVHGAVSQMTPQQYLDTAVGVYQSQGLAAWEVVTMGRA